jgi:hypothetical protein
MLPAALKPELTAHLQKVRLLHQKDLARGFGSVLLPDAKAGRTHRLSASCGIHGGGGSGKGLAVPAVSG